jgi:hypothetical protein
MANASDARTRTAQRALIVAAVVLFAALRAPYLDVPLERDEGEYAYIAQRMLAGDVPYRDAFDQKPPGVFVAYLAAFGLFGESVRGIHAFLGLWSAGSALALYGLVRRLAGGLPAAMAALLFAIASTDPRIVATAANTELFMLLPLVLSTSLMLRALDEDRLMRWVGCGALVMGACWFKPVAFTQALFVAGVVIAERLRIGPAGPSPIRAAGGLLAGAVLVSVPIVGALASQGAWEAFVDAVLLHNLAYSSALPVLDGLGHGLYWLAFQVPSFWLIWLLALAGLAWPGLAERRSRGLLAAWWLSAIVGLSIGFHFRPHYFVQWLPPICALAGIGAAGLARRALARPARGVAWAGFAAIGAGLVAAPLAGTWGFLRAGSPQAVSRQIYGLNPFVESPRIGDYIRRTSEPGESIYIVGSEPQILFYARRPSATRYIFFYPLTAGHPDARARQEEVMASVREKRPRYVVWVDLPASLLAMEHTDPYIFEASLELLARGYEVELIARMPKPEEAGPEAEYEFFYGSRARALLEESRREGTATPWVALFRRRS